MRVTGQRGWPDHLFVNRNGLHLWIEFKKPGKNPSKLQYYRIKQLRDQSAVAYWTDNLEGAKKLLDKYRCVAESIVYDDGFMGTCDPHD